MVFQDELFFLFEHAENFNFILTTVWCPSVALPLEAHKVGKVVLQSHAGGRSVAPVVHLAASEMKKEHMLSKNIKDFLVQ